MFMGVVWKAIIGLFIVMPLFGFGQQINGDNFKKDENAISVLMEEVGRQTELPDMARLNSKVLGMMKDILSKSGSFEYPFDSLVHIGKVISDDKLVRIFTWNIPQAGGTQQVFGLLQVKNRKSGEVTLFELTDLRAKMQDPANQIVGSQSWYGALYYQIAEKRKAGITYYLLLGVDLNNIFTSKRVIDVLHFDDSNQPQFGAPIFNNGKRIFARIIFEYSARASMMMRYIPELDMIVFDHLSPSRPEYAGDLRFYGPDFSYDGFKFIKGVWVLQSDLDLRNSFHPKLKILPQPPKVN